MRPEVGLRRGGARGPHRGEPVAVARDGRVGRIEPRQQRAGDLRPAALLGQAEEGPGALAEPLDQPGLGQQLEVARNARLRLAQDVSQIGYGQFGLAKQSEHAQPRLLTGRLEGGVERIEAELDAIGHAWASSHYIKISLYVETAVRKPIEGAMSTGWHGIGIGSRVRKHVGVPGLFGYCSSLKSLLSRAKEQTRTRGAGHDSQGFRHSRRRTGYRAARAARRRRLFHRPHPHALERAQGLPKERARIELDAAD